jgi:hypothetical protein
MSVFGQVEQNGRADRVSARLNSLFSTPHESGGLRAFGLRFGAGLEFRRQRELRAIVSREFALVRRYIFHRVYGSIRVAIKFFHFVQMKWPRAAPPEHDGLISGFINYAIAVQTA